MAEKLKNYETVFIATPVLSEEDFKQTVKGYTDFLKSNNAEILNEERWGLRQLAYPIDDKTTGIYYFIEFNAKPELIDQLELNFRRDTNIIRFLTSVLDKYGIEYNEKRRKGEIGRKNTQTEEEQQEEAE
ncbi:MAG: 30S ribosomal protein S6 [Bacteroidetes bacterium SW_11_45_7]|nr:MAG: 30S ribosomal protein S6 [Bacteroidetes bacterium SW_11_45_7]